MTRIISKTIFHAAFDSAILSLTLARLGESFQNLAPQFKIPKIKELTRLNWGAELIYRRIRRSVHLRYFMPVLFQSIA